jgi:hypothetical protein
MIAKWNFGSMVARLTSWRNPFHVVNRKCASFIDVGRPRR